MARRLLRPEQQANTPTTRAEVLSGVHRAFARHSPGDQQPTQPTPYGRTGDQVVGHRSELDAGGGKDRRWIWGLHLARTFAVVGLRGVRYRREVSVSLTQIADERQLDFIPAFERIVQQVYADRDAATLLPKALCSYCAVVCHHLSQGDRYPSALQHKLRTASATSLAQLPAEPLQAVIADMDAERAASLSHLLATL